MGIVITPDQQQLLTGGMIEIFGAVVGIAFSDLAEREGIAKIRAKLRGESPERRALKETLKLAYDDCMKDHPALKDSKFFALFLEESDVIGELDQYLTLTEIPDIDVLAAKWQSAYFPADSGFDIRAYLTDFLKHATARVSAHPLMRPYVNSHAFQELYKISQATLETNTLLHVVIGLLTELRNQTISEPAPALSLFNVIATIVSEPSHIPEKPVVLIGREGLQSRVETLLKTDKRALLQGFPGMGKTALAATIAEKWVIEIGPVLWIKARQANTDAILEGLVHPFSPEKRREIAAAKGDAKITLLLQVLADSNVTLLVIDDAWEAETLSPVLKGIPTQMPKLITSRNKLWGRGLVEVGKLDPVDSLKVLEWYADRDYADDAFAMELCQTLDHHALALKIAGDTLAVDRITPAELLSKYENALHDLEMASEEEGHRSIADALMPSFIAMLLEGKEGELALLSFMVFGAFFAPSITPELLALYIYGRPEIPDEMLKQFREKLPDASILTDEMIVAKLQQLMLKRSRY